MAHVNHAQRAIQVNIEFGPPVTERSKSLAHTKTTTTMSREIQFDFLLGLPGSTGAHQGFVFFVYVNVKNIRENVHTLSLQREEAQIANCCH